MLSARHLADAKGRAILLEYLDYLKLASAIPVAAEVSEETRAITPNIARVRLSV